MQYKKFPLFLIVSILGISLTVVVLSTHLYGQGAQKVTAARADEEKKSDKKPELKVILTMNDYRPLAVKDSRIRVTKYNFDRRFTPTGTGEFLDVVFEVNNETSKPIDLYAVVMAYYQTDFINTGYRRVIPFPHWRKNDPRRDQLMVHKITITPEDIDSAEIWNENDSDYDQYKGMVQAFRVAVETDTPIDEFYPPFWKYLSYFCYFPSKGLKFTLTGIEAPVEADAIQTNFIRPGRDVENPYEKLYKHKYTLEHYRRKTVFRSHHYSKFEPYYKFFNRVSVLLFDAQKAKKFEESVKSILPEKKAVQLKRNDLKKRMEAAWAADDDKALEKLYSEHMKIKGEEEAVAIKIQKLLDDTNPLVYNKTIRLNEIKKH